jgi:general secretion pathway protein A
MYRQYYGFKEQPFDITPDPNFLYLSRGHEAVLRSIIYGIQGRRGILAIIGEVGTGKTLLLNTALEWLSQKTKVAYVVNFDMSFDDLLMMALVELKLCQPNDDIRKAEALRRLNQFAQKQVDRGGNVALLVDEAQLLDRSAMENLRLLSNLETPKQKLVQIVMCGQPELETKLNQPELRQLAQRIGIRRTIRPLVEQETYEYIRHRLKIAGSKRFPLFSSGAKKMIWQYSEGIPRKINILCDNALLIGFQLRRQSVNNVVLQKTLKELQWEEEG